MTTATTPFVRTASPSIAQLASIQRAEVRAAESRSTWAMQNAHSIAVIRHVNAMSSVSSWPMKKCSSVDPSSAAAITPVRKSHKRRASRKTSTTSSQADSIVHSRAVHSLRPSSR
jgi:hypothetical protein